MRVLAASQATPTPHITNPKVWQIHYATASGKIQGGFQKMSTKDVSDNEKFNQLLNSCIDPQGMIKVLLTLAEQGFFRKEGGAA